MHHAATVVTWAAAVLAAGLLSYSLAGLFGGRGDLARRGDERAWHRSLGRCWMALFVLVETGPRLADWPSGVVLALSLVAFVPLLLAGQQLRRLRRG